MLEIKNVYKTYSSKNGVTHRALENVSLKFNKTGLIFILGKSGSGKSTLLNLIGGLDNFDRGEIIFNNKSFSSFKESDYDYYRNSCVGFVFQEFNLLNNLTVFENVSLSLDLQNINDPLRVDNILKEMEVYDLRNRKINELSGGQMQRVAIARALIKSPSIILADEPTGSLDSETSDAIIEILKKLAKERLVIVVTHNKDLAYENGDRIIEIRDGFILKDLLRASLIKDKKISTNVVSSSLVIVPLSCKVSKNDINELNMTIKEKRQDYYLLVENDKNRVMSLYPNVKEVINDDKKDAFVPFKYVDDGNINDNHIDSNLPLKKSIKFSLSNLKKKKFKLVFTILLSILAVLLTGTASNFTNYSLSKAVGMSIKHDGGKYLEVSSSFSLTNSTYTLQNSEIESLKELNKNTTFSYDINLPYRYSLSTNTVDKQMAKDELFKNELFKGFLVTDSITNLGYKNKNFKIIYEYENIKDEDLLNGVYISSIVANTIVKYSKYSHIVSYNSISELVGKNIFVDSNKYLVLGIYDIDDNQSLYKRFKAISDKTANGEIISEYNSISNNILLRLAVSNEFFNNYKKSKTSLDSTNGVYFETTSLIDAKAGGDDIRSINSIDIKSDKVELYYFDSSWNNNNFNEKIKSLKPNQIFIGKTLFGRITPHTFNKSDAASMKENINSYNTMNKYINIQSSSYKSSEKKNIYQTIDKVEVIGVIVLNNPSDTSLESIYIQNDKYQELIDNYYRPNRALLKMNGNENYAKIVQTLYDKGFTINNKFVKYFLDFDSQIKKYSSLINAVSIIWTIIVAILLYSFMSSSIKDNSKQIGILKALGANKNDIFKIYAVEAIIIGIFTTFFGVLGYYFGGLLLNRIITNLFYTFYFAIFIPNIITILIMILATFIILFISVIIPILKIDKIKPIDVINNVN